MSRKAPSEAVTSGSPSGEPVYLTVGYIRRPHGTHGEVIMDIHTDFPERLKKGARVFIGEQRLPCKVSGTRLHGKAMLISFSGYDSPEKVGIFRNSWLYVTATNLPTLPEGKVYRHQILGFSIKTDQDQNLGELIDIYDTGANKIYVVRTEENRELLLPAIPDVIMNINMQSRTITVHIINGLLDL